MKLEKQIAQALAGNQKAQRAIFQAYQGQLLNFILQRVDSLADAEEILQETFVSVFEALPFYRAHSSLLTWICAIAKHEVADFYRKKKLKTIVFSLFPFLERFVSKALGPEAIFEEKELGRKIKKVLGLLSEGYRQVLRLKYCQGLSVRAIAQRLGETEKAIESRLTRARQAFGRLYVVIEEKG